MEGKGIFLFLSLNDNIPFLIIFLFSVLVYLTIAISFLSPSLIQSFTITDCRLGYWPLGEGMIVAMTGAFHIYCKYTSLPIYTFYYFLFRFFYFHFPIWVCNWLLLSIRSEDCVCYVCIFYQDLDTLRGYWLVFMAVISATLQIFWIWLCGSGRLNCFEFGWPSRCPSRGGDGDNVRDRKSVV